MQDNQYNDRVVEILDSFLLSPAWKVLKYRLAVEYAEEVQQRINNLLRDGKMDRCQALVGKIDGVKDFIGITERLSKEIQKGQLDVDDALRH